MSSNKYLIHVLTRFSNDVLIMQNEHHIVETTIRPSTSRQHMIIDEESTQPEETPPPTYPMPTAGSTPPLQYFAQVGRGRNNTVMQSPPQVSTLRSWAHWMGKCGAGCDAAETSTTRRRLQYGRGSGGVLRTTLSRRVSVTITQSVIRID